jgi:hypothetical protein
VGLVFIVPHLLKLTGFCHLIARTTPSSHILQQARISIQPVTPENFDVPCKTLHCASVLNENENSKQGQQQFEKTNLFWNPFHIKSNTITLSWKPLI